VPLLSPPELLAQATLVVCEADAALQEALQLMLDGAGELTIVSTLEELPAVLQSRYPDLLMVDVDQQPDVLLHLTRLTSQYPDLKVVLIASDFIYTRVPTGCRAVGDHQFPDETVESGRFCRAG